MPLLAVARRFGTLRLLVGAATIVALLALLALRRPHGPGGSAGDSSGSVAVERRVFAAVVTAFGAIKPQIGAEVRVGSRLSGRVRRLRANIGDRVQRGQVIAELETEELDALIAQRRAELALAQSRLDAVITLSPNELARAEAAVASATATASLATAAAGRQQELLGQRASTQAEVDAARERSQVAQADLESSRRALELVRTGNTERRRQAEAERARAEAVLRSADVDRSFAVITAPISGSVASVSTQEGETVAAGLSAPTFLTIVDLGRLQVNAYVDEVDIGQVAVGQRVLFTVDAYPARDFEGSVAAIYPSATIQDNVVKYVVAVRIAGDSSGLLRPEMTASVRILLRQRSVLAVPARAIRRDSGHTVVWLLQAGGPVMRRVRVGWRDGSWSEIAEGLREGERVLLDAPLPAGTPGGPLMGSWRRTGADAVASLLENRQRTLLMMSGVAVGVAVLAAVIVAGQGTRERVMALVRKHGLDLLMVRAGGEVQVFAPRADRGLAVLFEPDARAIENELPNVALVSAVQNQRGINVVAGDRSVTTRAFGVEADWMEIRRWGIAEGEFLSEDDLTGMTRIVMLGAKVARELFPEGGAVGQTVRVGNDPYVVKGLFIEMGASAGGDDWDDRIVVPFTTSSRRLFNRPSLEQIVIRVADPRELPATAERVRALLRTRHAIGAGEADDFFVREPEDVEGAAVETSSTLTALLLAVAIIALMAGGLVIMNLMLAGVSQRSAEIGLRRAMGARSSDIARLFLAESLMVTLAGGLAGVTLGVAAAAGLSLAGFASSRVTWLPFAAALASCVAIGLLSGVLPARRAARLDPAATVRENPG